MAVLLIFSSLTLPGVETEPPALIPDTARAVEIDPWFGEDKFWHWAFSLTLVGSTYHLTHCRLEASQSMATGIALSFSLGSGLFKEFWDLKKPEGRFSYRDLIYDGLGVMMGYLLFIHPFR
jgi:uncharacterized protein YfiM (DUF2279 family)